MIPYPSGSLHIGHVKNYIISDIFNKFLKINKYNTYNHIGWDCFGTPAENISIKKSIIPFKWIKNNIIYMSKQLKLINFLNKWKKNYITSNIKYYKITQWIFLKLLEFNMIYIKNSFVNWDPIDNSVLSNEQVINGKGWRSGIDVKIIKKPTYFINLIYYKKELLEEIKNLDWPINIKLMQLNWIGNFKVLYLKFYLNKKKNYKYYILIKNLLNLFNIFFLISFNKKFYKNFIYNKYIKNKISYFNTGLNFKNKTFETKLELWITKLIKKKIFLYNNSYKFFLINLNNKDLLYFINKKFYNNIKNKNLWNIKNWGISRQRYWGTPIPIVICKNCGFFKNLYKKLPIILPKLLKPLIKKNILKINNFYLNSVCYLCRNKSFNEFENLDTFFDSSWYFLNYLNFKKKNNIVNKWFPIDFYIGGVEHAILHLLYSRFIIKFLRDIKYINYGEPIKKLFTLGMILNKTYYKLKNGVKDWLSKKEIKNNIYLEGKVEKMSKSKKNGLNPNNIIKNYGVDSLRLSVICFFDLNKDFLWKNKYVIISYNYIKIIWNLYKNYKNYIKIKNIYYKEYINYNEKKFLYFFYKNLKIINFFYLNFNYNKVFNSLFLILNIIIKIKIKNIFIFNEIFSIFLKYLYPIIPVITFKIWNILYRNQLGLIKNTLWNKIYYINLQNINYKFIIFINNKKKYIINYIKKNISLNFLFNYIFFKTKFFIKNFIKKIIFKKNIINILFN